jgi:hypothetical protein
MIKLCEKHSNELKVIDDGNGELTVPIRTNICTDAMPYYVPNAHDYWLYYTHYIKEIRFSKRDFIAELLYIAEHSINLNNGNELADLIVQQNTRYVYMIPTSGIHWDSLNQTHEDFMESVKDYNCHIKLMDVLQETRRCKIEQVTRFCHKLISNVRDFIEIEDLEAFENDRMYKVMMMTSIEEQEICSIYQKFNVSRDTSDPNIDYYSNEANRPTMMLQNLVKNLSKDHTIFSMERKTAYIGKIVELIKLIKNSFKEHQNSLHACKYVEIKLI